MFSGIANSMSTMHRLSEAKSRSISAENPTGEPGQGGRAETGVSASCARELGVGWKINPYVLIEPGQESVLADIHGAGAIEHIWMTIGPAAWREMILRMYWDDAPVPAVEVPAGDFFANGWNEYAPVNSLPICVNPARAFNCYWTMPFFKRARITMENRSDQTIPLYFQVDNERYKVENIPWTNEDTNSSMFFGVEFMDPYRPEMVKEVTLVYIYDQHRWYIDSRNRRAFF